jgi:hypothetical protein
MLELKLDKNEKVKKMLVRNNDGDTLHWSNGEMNVHDVLLSFEEQLKGIDELIITSWAIGRESVTVLTNMMNAGFVKRCKMVLDHRVKKNTPELLLILMDAGVEISFHKIHAKVMLAEKESGRWVLFTSANFTRNPSVEFFISKAMNEQDFKELKTEVLKTFYEGIIE